MSGYEDFFRTATGHDPYPYQVRLAHELETSAVLEIPTGLGKTEAVVLAWLWRRRFADAQVHANTPRRLIYCLPVRVLVSQTVERIGKMLERLQITDVHCAVLMGGEIDEQWDENPDADQILVGTQDQLISRALNRGYAMSRYRWPIHFAWLNSDVAWVYDEMQSMGATIPTSAQIQAFRDMLGTYGPTFSIWMSATTDLNSIRTVDFPEKLRVLQLDHEDREHPEVIRRLSAKKSLGQSRATASTKPTYYSELAQEAWESHLPGTLTLVVVNQVSRAQQVYQALQKMVGNTELVLIHSRFRAEDRERFERELNEPLPATGRIVVSTQVVEAGVDISAHCLIAELAPWSSMVQRFGRCNRYGDDDDAQVKWIDLSSDKASELPYDTESLEKTREILKSLSNVKICNLPQVQSISTVHQVIRRADLLALFDTGPDLSDMDLDVSRFIRDRESLDVAVLWRDISQGLDAQPAPDQQELCPVSLAGVRDYLASGDGRRAFVYRYLDGIWEEVRATATHPGQILLLDAAKGGYVRDIGFLPDHTELVSSVPSNEGVSEFDSSDPNTYIGRFVTLAEHLSDVKEEAIKLVSRFTWDWPADAIVEAAGKHDWGKAVAPFQTVLIGSQMDDAFYRQTLWAKSPARGNMNVERPHLRHELASALAVLQAGGTDLVAYLVAAHHGKVRVSIRSVRGERQPTDGGRYARGIWEGDHLPEVQIHQGTLPAMDLCLDVMEIGGGATEVSWASRIDYLLRRDFGPFRLAVMEAIVRIADWRGTRRELEGIHGPH